MSQVVELPDDAFARVRAEAERRGIDVGTVIAELADRLPSSAGTVPSRPMAFVGAGASAAGITPHMEELPADGFGKKPQR